MATKVNNISRIPQQVDLVDTAGKAAGSVRIMARRAVDLPDGYTVCARWCALNPGCVQVSVPEPAIEIAKPADKAAPQLTKE